MEREVQAPAIYDSLRNTMGNRMCTEFLNFLSNYELSPDDPNFEAYAQQMGGQVDFNMPVKFYSH